MIDQLLTSDVEGASAQAAEWLASFQTALRSGSVEAVTGLFLEDCYWRDLLAFSWNIVTVQGKDEIADLIKFSGTPSTASGWQLEGKAEKTADVITAWFTFDTEIARGRGNIRLRDGQCWTMFTSIVELKEYPEPAGNLRPRGTDHRPQRGLKHWPDLRTQEQQALGYTTQPYCVIVGGGQSGIMLAARLKRLNVPTLVIDRGGAPGDVWRSRYKSLYLHDPIWLNHLPYLPFPDHWPVFIPGQRMGDWLDQYTRTMELDYWSNTDCESATFDPKTEEWTVKVVRDGKPITLNPQQVVMATGLFGTPKIPTLPGHDTFTGNIYHSSEQFDITSCAGKRCIVVGTNSSAHDMAVALWEANAEVTMVQRSSAIVVRSSTLIETAISPLYSEDALAKGITTERADETVASVPHKLLAEFQKAAYQHIRAVDADFYDRLDKAGFKYDFGADESGLTVAAYRGRGFYIDVGGSELIARGEVKVVGGEVVSLTQSSAVLADGRELPAEIIIFATGYEKIATSFAKILGTEVAERVGNCWGLGAGLDGDPGPWEGELRNMWKPLNYPNLWIMAGNFALGRYYSRVLALQLKAHMEGINGPVYHRPLVQTQ